MLHKEVAILSPYVIQRVRAFNRGLRLRPPDNSPFWRHLTKKTLLCPRHYIPLLRKVQALSGIHPFFVDPPVFWHILSRKRGVLAQALDNDAVVCKSRPSDGFYPGKDCQPCTDRTHASGPRPFYEHRGANRLQADWPRKSPGRISAGVPGLCKGHPQILQPSSTIMRATFRPSICLGVCAS